MDRVIVAAVDSIDVVFFSLVILITFLLFFALFVFGIWLSRRPNSLSLYSRLPMRYAKELSYDSLEKVLRFLFYMHQYDNRIFSIKKASFCRETGRIFPDTVTWYNRIKLDWNYLQKRYPGHYVSWGSLTEEQQLIVSNVHDSLEGFQTDFSSPDPLPSHVEAKYAFTKPGPLYVDFETKVLLGWKLVPGTDLEVLIVQKPLNIIMPNVT